MLKFSEYCLPSKKHVLYNKESTARCRAPEIKLCLASPSGQEAPGTVSLATPLVRGGAELCIHSLGRSAFSEFLQNAAFPQTYQALFARVGVRVQLCRRCLWSPEDSLRCCSSGHHPSGDLATVVALLVVSFCFDTGCLAGLEFSGSARRAS